MTHSTYSTYVSPPIFGQALGPPESPDGTAASESAESDGRHGGLGAKKERAWKGLAMGRPLER